MKKGKGFLKGISLITAIAIAFSSMGVSAFAQDMSATDYSSDISANEETDIDSAASSDKDDASFSESKGEVVLNEDSDENNKAGNDKSEDTEEALSPDVRYIFENKVDDINYVFISLGDEGDTLSDVVLNYTSNGETKSISGECISNVAAFDIDGDYSLISIEGNINGCWFFKDLQEIDAQEGVEADLDGFEVIDDSENEELTEASDADYDDYIAQADLYDLSDVEDTLDAVYDESQISLASENGTYVVVVDPGHGPKNGGYTGANRTWDGVTYYEDVINMKIARYLKAELESYGNVAVYLTRDENSCPSLEERVKYAASLNADMLVSCHLNANTSESANGLMAMVAKVGTYNSANAQAGQNIATAILKELLTLGFGKNHGFYIRMSDEDGDPYYYPDGSVADYYGIVRYGQIYNVPSIIIEHGFLSNYNECMKYFSSENMIQALGKADAKGIAEYLGLTKSGSLNGWYADESNNVRYYINSVPQKGTVVIDGKKYWFDGDGILQFGWLNWNGMKMYFDKNNGGAAIIGAGVVDGTAYLFNQDGVMYSGNGVVKINGEYYYMYNGALLSGWYNFGGNVMCFDAENGYKAARGTVIMDGKKYWFDNNGYIQLGWLNWLGMKLYFDINNGGGALVGVGTVEGKRYLFNSDGVMYTGTGVVQDGGNYYYLYNNQVLGGWYNFNGNVMCFDAENGYKAAVGTVVMGGKKYWFDEKGILQLGWCHWNGMSLYFDINYGGGALVGVGTVEGKRYLFNSDGVMYTGTGVVQDGGSYYYVYNNQVLSGWYDFDGNVMCFDASNGYKAAIGTVIMDGKKYWFNEKGVLQFGWLNWNGMSLYFDINNGGGAIIGPGMVDGIERLFNEDGVLLTGTGLKTVNNKLYYVENGELQSGWKTVNGKKMYFDASTYVAAQGTVIIDGKKYLFDSDGTFQTGWFTWMGMKMYFDPDNGGAAVTGSKEMDGYKYTFNSDGVLIGQETTSIVRTDPNSGRTYTLEGRFLTDPQIGVDVTEDEFFAAVVYAEAGVLGLPGQTAVAMVILNRLNHSSYANTLSYVIYQKSHFEVARNGSLTKYLEAFRDDDESILKYIRNAKTMEAVQTAKQIMEAYKTNGTPRKIDGISSEYNVEDFTCLYFTTQAAFERQNLDPEKCETFQYKNTVFFNKWIKKS